MNSDHVGLKNEKCGCGICGKILGMISHKKSIITIFGHKHEIKNFIIFFYIFHEKISTAFGFWFIFGVKMINFEAKSHKK